MFDTEVRLGTTLFLDRPDGSRIYEITLGADELLRCRSAGLWTVASTDAYVADLRYSLAQARDAFGIARVLFDLADSVVQSPQVIERFAEAEAMLYEPRDKRAFVVESPSKRMQLRRALITPGTPVFMTIGEAERWLLEHR